MPDEVGFRVQRKRCATCIYREDCALDIQRLEDEVKDRYGFFESHRQCHHTNENPACCRGFWDLHKDEFQAGQIAQRLDMVIFVDVDEL